MTKKEILQQIKELKKQVEQLDSEYPKYMLAINQDKHKQFIVKFISEKEGIVVATAEKALYEIDYRINFWSECSDTEVWKEVSNPDELCDKDIVECWDDKYTHCRLYRFYDAKNNCVFSEEGHRNGPIYQHYRKLMPWEELDWMGEAREVLEN